MQQAYDPDYERLAGTRVRKRIYNWRLHCYVDVEAVSIGRAANVWEYGKQPDPDRVIRRTDEDRGLFHVKKPKKVHKRAMRRHAEIAEYLRSQPDNKASYEEIAEAIGQTVHNVKHHIGAHSELYEKVYFVRNGKRCTWIKLRRDDSEF